MQMNETDPMHTQEPEFDGCDKCGEGIGMELVGQYLMCGACAERSRKATAAADQRYADGYGKAQMHIIETMLGWLPKEAA